MTFSRTTPLALLLLVGLAHSGVDNAGLRSDVRATVPPRVIEDGSFPAEIRAVLGDAPCLRKSMPSIEGLIASPQMLARQGRVIVNVPFEEFADYILQPQRLPTWNTDYSDGGSVPNLPVCTTLEAKFTTRINVTIPSGFTFKQPTILTSLRTENVGVFGWEFGVTDATAQNDFYKGAHWIYAERVVVNGREHTLFITWEKIASLKNDFVEENSDKFEDGMGATVQQPDLNGAMCLEHVYSRHGALRPADVEALCSKAKIPYGYVN